MAKNVHGILLIKSKFTVDGSPKLPTPDKLREGELAINYAENVGVLSYKTESGNVATISSDEYYTSRVLGSGFTGDNSGNTVTQYINILTDKIDTLSGDVTSGDIHETIVELQENVESLSGEVISGFNEVTSAITELDEKFENKLGSAFTGEYSALTVTEYIEDNEEVISSALNDLNNRVNELSGSVVSGEIYSAISEVTSAITELDDEFHEKLGPAFSGENSGLTVTQFVYDKLGSAFTGEYSALTVTEYIDDNEKVISSALNDLNNRVNELSGSVVSGEVASAITEIYEMFGPAFTGENSGTTVTEYIDNKLGSGFTSENSGITVTEYIDNKLGSGFTGDNSGTTVTEYVEKEIINTLGSGFTGEYSGRTVTEYIEDNEEVISSALNDLNDRISEISGSVVSGDIYSAITDIESGITEIYNMFGPAFSGENSGLTVTEYVENKLGSGFTGDNSGTTVTEYIENKLGSGFTGDNSGVTVTEYIEDNEKVISSALNDLNDRISTISGSVVSGDIHETIVELQENVESLSGEVISGFNEVTSAITEVESGITEIYNMFGPAFSGENSGLTVTEYVENKLGSGFTGEYSGRTVTEYIEDNEEVISSALNDLNDRINELSGSVVSGEVASAITELEDEFHEKLGPAFSGENSGLTVTEYVENKINESLGSGFTGDNSGVTVTEYIENKLGSGFTGDNSGVTVTEYIEDNEKVISSALNDLNSRISEISGSVVSGDIYSAITDIESGITEIYNMFGPAFSGENSGLTVTEYVENKLGSGFTGEYSGLTITKAIEDNEKVISSALNDLNDRISEISGSVASGDIYSAITEVEDKLEVLSGEVVNEVVSAITELDEKFEDKLGSGFTGAFSALTITEVIEDNEEVISSALNDLNGRINELSGSVVSGEVASAITEIEDKLEVLSGEVVNEVVSAITELDEKFEDKLGSGFTGAFSGLTITKAIEDNEKVVSSALNDLNSRVNELSGSVVSGDIYSAITEVEDKLEVLSGEVVNEVVSAITELDEKFEDKLGSGFTGAYSGRTITKAIEDNEKVISSALNDLNDKISALSGSVVSGDIHSAITEIGTLSGEVNSAISEVTSAITELDEKFEDKLGSGFTGIYSGRTITEVFLENERITATSLNDLNTRIPTVDLTIIQNSTNPVCGGAVYDALGNIEALLANI